MDNRPVPTSIRIPESLMKLVKQSAKIEKRSITKQIEMIIEEYYTKPT